MLDRQHRLHVSVQLPPSIFSGVFAAIVDTPLVEILSTLTGSNNGEALTAERARRSYAPSRWI